MDNTLHTPPSLAGHAENRRQARALSRCRSAELAELFSTLSARPAPKGYLHGRLMAITGLNGLPRSLAQGLYLLLRLPINPWRGKSFHQGEGFNRWLTLRGPAFGAYRVEDRTGADGNPSLWLNYDVPANPALLRRISTPLQHALHIALQVTDQRVELRQRDTRSAGVHVQI